MAQPGELLLGHLARSTAASRPRGCRRRARCGPRTSRRTAGRRCRRRCAPAASSGWPAHRRAAEQQGDRLARAQHLGDVLDGLRRRPPRRGDPASSGGTGCGAVAPRHVGGQDQRGDLARAGRWPRRRPRRWPGRGRRCAPAAGSSRDTLRAAVSMSDVQRGVEPGVVRGVVADDVDHRRRRPAGVVQVGQPVAEPGPEVQQRGRRARRPCGRSRRRHRWRRPRTGRARRASRAPSSSAATKCISLVPGLVKHVVTPASTSVRIMASAPFMAPPCDGQADDTTRWRRR